MPSLPKPTKRDRAVLAPLTWTPVSSRVSTCSVATNGVELDLAVYSEHGGETQGSAVYVYELPRQIDLEQSQPANLYHEARCRDPRAWRSTATSAWLRCSSTKPGSPHVRVIDLVTLYNLASHAFTPDNPNPTITIDLEEWDDIVVHIIHPENSGDLMPLRPNPGVVPRPLVLEWT